MCMAPRDLHPEILFSRSLYIRPILILSRMKKSTAMFHTKIFPILFCITYKKKTSGYGSNWDCSVGLVTGSMLDRCDHSSTPMYKTSSSQSSHIFTLLRSPMLLIRNSPLAHCQVALFDCPTETPAVWYYPR